MEGRAVFLDASPDGGGWGRSRSFGAPLALRRAFSVAEVQEVVAWADQEAKAGRWVVLALAYEAAPAFDSALCVHSPQQELPLVWAASHAEPLADAGPGPQQPSPEAFTTGPWRAKTPPASYAGNIARLKAAIRDGEIYQANYTIGFDCAFAGDDRAWFAKLAQAQGGGFCAWLDMGRSRVLSLSPELFFRLDHGRVLARPMKGTAPRTGEPEADRRSRAALAACPKNRSENVMIVDLLRSDLGRVARPGSVRVPRLFHVEDYPSLFQMTSDVEARLKEGAGLPELLAALFPCGSVTGAPKIRAMQLLRELEPRPRGIYCGAIGLLEPGGGKACFSVPIRTITLDRDAGLAAYNVGGGVTHGSEAAMEYAECLTKMRFLIPPEEDFELLESLLLLNGRFPLLAAHAERLGRSAAHFGFVLDLDAVRTALAKLAAAHPYGRFKARLLAGRGGSLRAEAAPISGGRPALPLRLGFAPAAVDSRHELLGHKTTRRAVYERAFERANSAMGLPGPEGGGAQDTALDDVLLLNERGEVTESTRANLVLLLDGELVTPALASGLLPGVFRGRLVARGLVRERVLHPQDVLRAGRIWLVNAVRWWMPCVLEAGGRMFRESPR